MTLSTQTAVSDGTLTYLDIAFEYLDRSEISVFINSVPATGWTWGVGKRIVFTAAVPDGYTVLVRRSTDVTSLRHEFSRGAQFTSAALDEDLKQCLHVAQEMREGNLSTDFFQDVDFHGFRIKNLGRALSPGDAVPLSQLAEAAAEGAASALGTTVRGEDAIPALPVRASRANKLLSFDSAGNPQAVAPASGSAAELALSLAGDFGATLIGYLNQFTGAVRNTVAQWMGDHDVTIREFGASVDLEDNAPAIQRAIDAVASQGGGVVLVPAGTWRIRSLIQMKEGVTLRGVSRNASVIFGRRTLGGDTGITGIDMNTSIHSCIEKLRIRTCDVGIRNDKHNSYFSIVRDCHITLCRIGILYHDAYINSLHGNLIDFNGCGMVCTGQGYAVHILDNLFENNTGGCGLICTGSAGAIVENNTIEGNRNINSVAPDGYNPGIGLWVFGTVQRLIVRGNWFETNGLGMYSTDVLIGYNASAGLEVTTMVSECTPNEYIPVGADYGFVGGLTFQGNHHYATRFGYTICNNVGNPGSVVVRDDTFSGELALLNRPVRIFQNASGGSRLSFDNLNIINTGANAADVTAYMRGGIGGTPVFVQGVTPADGLVTVDGQDLYTVKMTAQEFLALPGATLTPGVRTPSGGYAELQKNVRCSAGGPGFYSRELTDRCRLGPAPLLTIGVAPTVIVLGNPGMVAVYDAQVGGPGAFGVNTGHRRKFSVNTLGAPADAELYVGTGTVVGYAVMTAAQGLSTFKGRTRLEIVDLDLMYIAETNTAPPIDSARFNARGYRVENTETLPGGYAGWVCVTEGAPAAFKGYGLIQE